MQEQVLRAIQKCKEENWITVNEKLTDEAVASVFVEIMKDMSLKDFVEIFSPKW